MATSHFLNWIEGQAFGLRSKCGLKAFDRLDPFKLAEKMDVVILDPSEIAGLTKETLDQLLLNDSKAWSAGTLHLPDGRDFVVINPTHDVRRRRASIMEELAHVALGHKPSQLVHHNGICIRSWNQTQETQAYWVGAAALVPRHVIKGAKTLGLSRDTLAERHGVSVELVGFREKVVGVRL